GEGWPGPRGTSPSRVPSRRERRAGERARRDRRVPRRRRPARHRPRDPRRHSSIVARCTMARGGKKTALTGHGDPAVERHPAAAGGVTDRPPRAHAAPRLGRRRALDAEDRERHRDRRAGEVPVPQDRTWLHDDHDLAALALIATAFNGDETGVLAERE